MSEDDDLLLDLYRPDGLLIVEYRAQGRRIAAKTLRELLMEPHRGT